MTNNLWGVVWVMGLVLTPPIFFQLAGPMRAIDPALEEAARISGASNWRVMWCIDLPLIWPSILGALIYTFITAVSIFEIPCVTRGGQRQVAGAGERDLLRGAAGRAADGHLRLRGRGRLRAVPHRAQPASRCTSTCACSPRPWRYQVISGKGYRPRDVELGKLTWPALAFVLLYLALAVLLPLLVLVYASLLPLVQMPTPEVPAKLTLANYNGLLVRIGGPNVLRNTLLLVAGVALIVTLFSFMISWLVVRTQMRGRQLLDIFVMVPHAIPALAFAFALAMAGIVALKWLPWLPFAGTLGIIAIAHVIARLPYATRLTNGALLQVHHELEEVGADERRPVPHDHVAHPAAARSSPPGLPGAVDGVAQPAGSHDGALSSGPNNRVLSVSVWDLWQAGAAGPRRRGQRGDGAGPRPADVRYPADDRRYRVGAGAAAGPGAHDREEVG